jgi:acyl dehydratase
MVDPKARATVPFDEIEPGDPLGTFSYDVTEELADRHRRATEQAPYPDPTIAPISMLAADGVNLADRFWDISQAVHAGQVLTVNALPRIGDRLTVTGVARDKFVKRGRRYVVSETHTANARGEEIVRGLMTGVLVYGEGETERDGGTPATSAPPEPPPVLTKLGPLVRTMTREHMILYEPPGEVNIHTDDEVARAAGLPAAIATGTLFLGYVFDLLYQTYGMRSLVGTALDVRIRLPVFAGDRLETIADVIDRERGRTEHAVAVRGPRGDVIVGHASVRYG